MSAATKRKHVVKEMLEDFEMPRSKQLIVQVLGTSGSNLHEVLTPHRERFLASLPMKFRKNIWIKRGDFVVVEPIEEGDKVKAEIVRILYPQHIKAIKQCNLWPDQFQTSTNVYPAVPAPQHGNYADSCESIDDTYNSSEESEDDFSDIPMNTNRPPLAEVDDSEDEITSEED